MTTQRRQREELEALNILDTARSPIHLLFVQKTLLQNAVNENLMKRPNLSFV